MRGFRLFSPNQPFFRRTRGSPQRTIARSGYPELRSLGDGDSRVGNVRHIESDRCGTAARRAGIGPDDRRMRADFAADDGEPILTGQADTVDPPIVMRKVRVWSPVFMICNR